METILKCITWPYMFIFKHLLERNLKINLYSHYIEPKPIVQKMTSNADLAELMKKNKADIAKNTLRTYASLLRNLYYNSTGKPKEEAIDMSWYHDEDTVLKALENKPAGVRKTILAGLMALVGKEGSAKYRKQMMDDRDEYDEWVKKQEMSDRQKQNWKTFDEVSRVVQEYEARARKIMNDGTILPSERRILVDWMILALTTGYYFPPRRSMDYFLMKFREFDKKEDNFLDKNTFVFNKYKTAKTYNQQSMEIPKSFRPLLSKYIKTIPDGVNTLLYDAHGNEMYAVKITQRLNSIFGAKVSVSMLRHIFLTSKLGDVPPLKQLEELAENMGHSVSQQLEYIKR